MNQDGSKMAKMVLNGAKMVLNGTKIGAQWCQNGAHSHFLHINNGFIFAKAKKCRHFFAFYTLAAKLHPNGTQMAPKWYLNGEVS